ncbi:MAG: GNAT family N-acetyltransferase [Bacteroidia bacterium]
MNLSNHSTKEPVLNTAVFSSFPVLRTSRLLLRSIAQTDTDRIFNFYHNPQVMQFRGADCFEFKQEASDLIQEFADLFTKGKGIRWGICMQDKEEALIGSAGLKSINSTHLRAELGYELDPECWNQGLMTEALSAITAFCFNEMQLHTLEANITPANIASERVLEKLHFVREAYFRENWYYKGWWDSAIFTLRNPDQ